jgi:hypothetical protein
MSAYSSPLEEFFGGIYGTAVPKIEKQCPTFSLATTTVHTK